MPASRLIPAAKILVVTYRTMIVWEAFQNMSLPSYYKTAVSRLESIQVAFGDFIELHSWRSTLEFFIVDLTPIPKQEARGGLLREGLNQTLRSLHRDRVVGQVEAQYASPVMRRRNQEPDQGADLGIDL